MATMEIKRVGVLSFAKISGIVLAGVGVVIGVIYGLFFMLFGAAMLTQNNVRGAGPGAGGMVVVGIIAMIGVPIFYGGIGFIFGALYAVIYNAASGFVGGIELEMEDKNSAYFAPPPPQQDQWNQPNSYQPGQQPPSQY